MRCTLSARRDESLQNNKLPLNSMHSELNEIFRLYDFSLHFHDIVFSNKTNDTWNYSMIKSQSVYARHSNEVLSLPLPSPSITRLHVAEGIGSKSQLPLVTQNAVCVCVRNEIVDFPLTLVVNVIVYKFIRTENVEKWTRRFSTEFFFVSKIDAVCCVMAVRLPTAAVVHRFWILFPI